MGLQRRAWEIEQPSHGRIVREELALPGPGEVLVQAEWGAVSPGSEFLAFSGTASGVLDLDGAALGSQGPSGAAAYPVRYGYILTGRVSFCGSRVDSDEWLGRRVYAFHSHATHAVLPVDNLLPIPAEIPADVAPLYANAETALSLHWDAGILPGETVVIVGAGIVGMLVTAIAQRTGAGLVVLVESDPQRRQWAEQYLLGSSDGRDSLSAWPVEVVASLDEAGERLQAYPGQYRGTYEGFDVGFELTGNAAVLDSALDVLAFGGRMVVGSWYGDRGAELHLGGRFHRSRLRIVSSQVSTIPLSVAGRIDYERRSRIVWHMLPRLRPEAIARREITLDELDELFTEISQGIRVEPWVAIRY